MRNAPPEAAVLSAACRRLVSTKYRIDDFMDELWRCPEISAVVLRDPLFQMLGISGATLAPCGIDWLEVVGRDPGIDDDLWLPARSGAGNCGKRLLYSTAPHSFARLVLPSTVDGGEYRHFTASDLTLAEIDPALVIGGTYQCGWPAVRSARELDLINAKAAAAAPGLDTVYLRVGTLPLYVAVEGKNRARAFRAAGKAITGFTAAARFPDPEALELHEIAGSPGAAAPDLAVSHTRSGAVQVLALPAITAPLLEAYGVRWGRMLPCDAVDGSGRALRAARRAVLEDLVRHFMHP
jgi:hypothetical protein